MQVGAAPTQPALRIGAGTCLCGEIKADTKRQPFSENDMLPFEDTEKEKLYLRRELFLCGRGTYPLKDLLKQ